MTPAEQAAALATALAGVRGWAMPHEHIASQVLAALDAAGVCIAEKQDAADGKALRLLREAVGEVPFGVDRYYQSGDDVRAWVLRPERLIQEAAPTIAAAADAAREALP